MADGILDFNSRSVKEACISRPLNAAIEAALTRKQKAQPERDYLGASAVGDACERRAQFSYAGAPREKDFKPETLRKFDLGHMGEELARAWFGDAGFVVRNSNPRTGQPYGFSQLDGRFKGHVDGVFLEGPDVPGMGYPCLWECKSVGSKTYREIERNGLKKARRGYYAQVQVYMAYLGLTEHPAVFTVNNLDTGEQLHLAIPFDAEEAQAMTDRAVRIVKATEAGELLPRPFRDRSFFECKFCAFEERCWGLPS